MFKISQTSAVNARHGQLGQGQTRWKRIDQLIGRLAQRVRRLWIIGTDGSPISWIPTSSRMVSKKNSREEALGCRQVGVWQRH